MSITLKQQYDEQVLNSSLERTSDQVVSLARELRNQPRPVEVEDRDGTTQAFPNFTRLLQLSGRLVLANDIAAVFLAFVAGAGGASIINIHLLGFGFQELIHPDTLQQFAIFGGLGFVALFWLDVKGHYRQRLPYWEAIGHIVTVTTLGFVGSGFVQFLVKDPSSRLWMMLSWALFGTLLILSRIVVRRGLEHRGRWKIPALVVGKGPTAAAAMDALKRDHAMGFNIIGNIAPSALEGLARPQAWKQLLRSNAACHIFLALEGSELERHPKALKSLANARVPCSIVPPWLGLPSSTLSPHHFMMQDVLLLHDTNRLELPLPRMLKRSFDFLVSMTALICLSPLFLVLAIGVKREGGPAFFSQPRVGRHGRQFQCFKFRSMRMDAEQKLAEHLASNPEAALEWQQFQKLKDDVRITRFGQFIRRTSLDELPQLFNVLMGDMSLVGPRPIMLGQEEFYAEDFSLYAAVRPGITGPWQVSGRNRLLFVQRVALESWYARNWSLWMDIVILLKRSRHS